MKSLLKRYLEENAPLIDAEMFALLPEAEPRQFLYEPMRDYPLRGGKRFRAALVLLSCEALGGEKHKALRTAAAFEMFQSFALIHDDIEDGSEMRRGKPCLHRLLGIPLSINAGDALYAKVFEALSENRQALGDRRTLELIQEMIRGARLTFEGQALDIGWTGVEKIPTIDEFMGMLRLKTGWYSGRGPSESGAIIADACGFHKKAIGDFGEAMAIAFQIRDDLLNLTVRAEDAVTAPATTAGGYGKERGGDIAEGKRTLMVIDVCHACSAEEQSQVLDILAHDRSRTTKEEIEWLIALMDRHGSISRAEEVCWNQAREAQKHLGQIPDSEARDILREMCQFLVERIF